MQQRTQENGRGAICFRTLGADSAQPETRKERGGGNEVRSVSTVYWINCVIGSSGSVKETPHFPINTHVNNGFSLCQ